MSLELFNERLAHLCALFEVDPPEIVYEDGEPLVTDGLMDWVKANKIDIDWLFWGKPSAMLREWAKALGQEREASKLILQLEPEVQAGMRAFLRAVVIHGVSIKEAEPLFAQVVQEFRASQAA